MKWHARDQSKMRLKYFIGIEESSNINFSKYLGVKWLSREPSQCLSFIAVQDGTELLPLSTPLAAD